jgi:hypothetical protein
MGRPIDRDELWKMLLDAPQSDDPSRLGWFGRIGQLFGWIAGPDQQFLVNWLPDVARDYPIYPMRIVEVGTFAGSTARGLVTMTGGGSIVCIDNMVDVHQGARGNHPSGRAFWEATIGDNGANLRPFARLIEGNSADVGRGWTDPIDLLFIDGDHSEQAAYDDMQLFAKHVVSGGYCLVDDHDMTGVVAACDRYFKDDWELVGAPSEPTAKIIAYRRK